MISVVTGNEHKFCEIKAILSDIGEVFQVDLFCPEIQHADIGIISQEKARYAYSILKQPLITDDTGLFIPSLQGFPGPYAAFVHDTIGNSGILRLLEGASDANRSAWFETAIAYADESGVMVFRGRIDGTIAYEPRGDHGFGYDPIFEVDGMTLAEMESSQKNELSHRARGVMQFHDWFINREKDT
ncbi:MAG: RdgB/HAM1 family non-canonical purine NTP pyrophosphatase [Methanomicrobiales archaeon]|nr:RdgB/HAM1 family non-canonical purine NTP pyrophosphatase [Methanomicrobiales archaeon]